MTVTSAPIGSTAQSLDGFAVDAHVVAAFRESVVLTGPDSSTEVVVPTSTQTSDAYGMPVWVQGTPNVSVAAMPAAGPTSTHVISSIPFYVAQSSAPWGTTSQIVSSLPLWVSQSSAPWEVRGGVAVTNTANVALVGTSQVFGTVSSQIVSSIPFFVAQSSGPWDVRGGIAVTNAPNVNVTNVPAVNITTSIPFFVAQSSAPWLFVETISTNAGVTATSYVLLANLNTTVVRNTKTNLYHYTISNFASTALHVKLANASTAGPASTAPFLMRIAAAPSTTVHGALDVPATFSTGIVMYTTREAWNTGLTAPLGSTAVVNLGFV